MTITTNAEEMGRYTRRQATKLVSGLLIAAVHKPALLRAEPLAEPAQHDALGAAADQIELLASIIRTLFPHDFIGETTYTKAATDVDLSLQETAPVRDKFYKAARKLPPNFGALSQVEREDLLRSQLEPPDIIAIRGSAVNAVYGDPAVWDYFDYEAPSINFGGWIKRDLVTIDWPRDYQ